MGTTGLPSVDHAGRAPLRQRQAMTTDEIKSLNARLGGLNDWYSTCPQCMTNLHGSLTELRAHQCETTDGT